MAERAEGGWRDEGPPATGLAYGRVGALGGGASSRWRRPFIFVTARGNVVPGAVAVYGEPEERGARTANDGLTSLV